MRLLRSHSIYKKCVDTYAYLGEDTDAILNRFISTTELQKLKEKKVIQQG